MNAPKRITRGNNVKPRITNNAGLPEPIMRAITNDNYSAGDADFSVTELIAPTQQVYLKYKHADELTEDASDMIWLLLGKSVHYIIEQSAGDDDIQEVRLSQDFEIEPGNVFKISGQIDNYNVKTKTITDYKLTSVWKTIYGDYADYEKQLNLYALLLILSGEQVDKVEVCLFLRDWNKNDRRNDYPTYQAKLVPMKRWSKDEACHFVSQALHDLDMAFRFDSVRECTAEERWATEDTWAVMKSGNKRALRVCGSEVEAEKWMSDWLLNNPPAKGKSVKLYVEFRPGKNKRCEKYCNVRDFCPQYKKMKEMSNE